MAPGDKNVPNQGPTLEAVTWTLAGLSTIVLAARLYVRAIVVSRVGLDDYLMLLSWCGNIIFASLLTKSVHYGLGKHIFDLTEENAKQAMRWDFTAQAWGVLTPMWGRWSFSVSLLSLVGTSKVKKYALHFFIWAQILAGVSTVILIYVQCGTKIEALWDHKVRETANCWSPDVQTYYGYFQSSVNSLTDLFLTIMPTWILWTVQLQTRFKIALAVLLGLSVFAMAASIVKTYELTNLGLRNDFTWNTPIFFIWVVVELNIVIIAASIPTLKPLFSKKKGSSYYGARSYEMYGSTLRNNASGTHGGTPSGIRADRDSRHLHHHHHHHNHHHHHHHGPAHKAWVGTGVSPGKGLGSLAKATVKEIQPSDGSSEENILPVQSNTHGHNHNHHDNNNNNNHLHLNHIPLFGGIQKTMDVDVTVTEGSIIHDHDHGAPGTGVGALESERERERGRARTTTTDDDHNASLPPFAHPEDRV